jgi:hypothetical protein
MPSIRACTISSNASSSPWRARSTSDRSLADSIGFLRYAFEHLMPLEAARFSLTG